MFRFAATGCAALLVLAIGSVVVVNQQSVSEARRDAKAVTSAIARGVIAPQVTEGLLAGDPELLARLDRDVRERVLSQNIVRAKLWSADGRVLYSDQRELIGRQYNTDDELDEALRDWTSLASVSDLSRPENVYERPFGKLLEVYHPLRTPEGTPVILELYQQYDAVAANGLQIFTTFVPILVVALALLQAFQVPLAWSMASRLQAGQRSRELLLQRAVQAQDLERKRIARDVHDGVVQDMIGLSLKLSGAAERVGRDPEPDDRAVLRDAASRVRGAVRSLRSFLVDIYPPTLEQAALEASLSDLAEPLRARGVAVELDLQGLERLDEMKNALIYRAAQEALRNVARHAAATHVRVRIAPANAHTVLTISDDGVGFDPNAPTEGEGHLGLAILRDLAEEGGGRLELASEPSRGTTMTLELPIR